MLNELCRYTSLLEAQTPGGTQGWFSNFFIPHQDYLVKWFQPMEIKLRSIIVSHQRDFKKKKDFLKDLLILLHPGRKQIARAQYKKMWAQCNEGVFVEVWAGYRNPKSLRLKREEKSVATKRAVWGNQTENCSQTAVDPQGRDGNSSWLWTSVEDFLVAKRNRYHTGQAAWHHWWKESDSEKPRVRYPGQYPFL